MSSATVNASLMSRTAVVSFSSGIVFVVVTLVAVALLNLPKSADAAVAGGSASCPLAEVSLDPGYGVTRMSLQPVCRDDAGQTGAGNTAAR